MRQKMQRFRCRAYTRRDNEIKTYSVPMRLLANTRSFVTLQQEVAIRVNRYWDELSFTPMFTKLSGSRNTYYVSKYWGHEYDNMFVK